MRATAVPLVEVAASLHGRTGEQERLLGLLGDARVGHSGAVVVVGEPGAGKSALLEVVRTAAEGMVVLEAKGVESEARLPFAALHQLLRPAFGLLERLPSPQADALRAAFALEGGGAPDLYRDTGVVAQSHNIDEEGPAPVPPLDAAPNCVHDHGKPEDPQEDLDHSAK